MKLGITRGALYSWVCESSMCHAEDIPVFTRRLYIFRRKTDNLLKSVQILIFILSQVGRRVGIAEQLWVQVSFSSIKARIY